MNPAFDEIAARSDGPMFVVTTAVGAHREGCLVGFATQCSIDPVRFLVCLSLANATESLAQGSELLVVHALRADQVGLARLFGEVTGDDVDKFAHVSWRPGPGGAPVLDGCDWFAGRVLARHGFGDHAGYLLEVLPDAGTARGPQGASRQLGFQAVRDLDAGHPA